MNNLLLSASETSAKFVSALTGFLGNWYVIIFNAFGVIAIIGKMLEYQSKKRNVAFIIAMCAQVSWLAYFLFSGDFVSVISCIMSFLSVLIFSQRKNHAWAKSVWWLVGFLVLQTVLCVFTFKNWKDIFVIGAGFSGVFAYYCVDMRKYRTISFFFASFWLLNSIMKLYVLALISDAISVISVSIGKYRYDIRKKKLDLIDGKNQIQEQSASD